MENIVNKIYKIGNSNKNKENIINIAYGVDDNYAYYMLVSMCSFCENNKMHGITFHIITNGISKKYEKKLYELTDKYCVNVIVYEIKIDRIELPIVSDGISIGTYFRIFLPELLNDINRIIYVDADIICCNDIAELTQLSLEGKMIAGVSDLKVMQKRNADLQLGQDNVYINAGMLVINVKKWIDRDFRNKIIQILNEHKEKILFEDQDALNIAAKDDILLLPRMYNCIDMYNYSIKECKLLHFASHPKPWSKWWILSPNNNYNTKNIFAEYERKIFSNGKRTSANMASLIKWIIKLLGYKMNLLRGRYQ